MPQRFQDADALAQAIVERVGRTIVLGLPLGLGERLTGAVLPAALLHSADRPGGGGR
ncbi:hypothetical protein LQ948_01720 [Jiella sp. MQZ9-1]|uniref:Uncharacterized protein n=1 Tax=Jiella flava TaxID=2816857 RepID=A0A939JUC5_9HYPH|nr:hypothetical protein [Jiella flava]MBO0661279.1 hypothetical protein [Jiella flava]MCD2469924.1 hypothetical protein [Jiella flava]